QASDMVQRLSQLGAQVVEIPTVRITPTNQALPMDTLSQSQWLVFTSVNGVNIFFDKLKQEKRDIRALVGLKIAVVGTVTAQAVTDRGLCVDYMPEIFTAKQLVQGLRERLTADDRVLCILGNLAERCDIPNATRFDAYTTTPEAFDLTAEMLQTTHYLIFASSSAVHHFVQRVQAVGLPMPTATTVCIGPVTADTAKKAGLTTVTADTHTIDGVLQKLMALEGKG
ncbi:MAG: uroporphyrinogen-III synthase, partial [Hyphomonadaceae bacterium]|nr:uroporphyrinogen-III synthase [Clostridia bacterium]